MKYISIDKMNDLIKTNLKKIPKDIDLIVGNPRSGVLPATIISLLMNLPLCDIDSFTHNKIYSYGSTKKNNFIKDIKDARKILIVEDSSYSGNSIEILKSKIPDELKNKCVLLVLFVNKNTKNMCDIYFEEINESRIFEWNLFHHRYLNYGAIDLNILYENNFLKIKPTQKIEAIIIDNNLNKKEIEKILKEYSVEFERVLYINEIDEKIKFLISNDIEKYNDYNIDIIDYNKGLYYKKV